MGSHFGCVLEVAWRGALVATRVQRLWTLCLASDSLGLICLCVCVCVCVCVCARTYIQPRHYTLEVSEEGRQWFLVHRCIVDPAKGEGDKVIEGEEHITALHQVCFCVCVHSPVCVGLSVLLFIVLASAKLERSRRSCL